MRARLQRSISLKLLIAFVAVLGALIAQDPTSYLTPDVTRVGDHLACRCSGCRNTVGNCPMLRCSFADPMRRRIYQMKITGMSDQDVVNNIVREEGAVALATPPTDNFGGILTWVMPGVVLVVGFFIWSAYVRRNQKTPEVISAADQAKIEKYRAQMDKELGDSELDHGPQKHS